MHVLRVTSEFYPYIMGGIGVHAYDLSIDQVTSGTQVDIVTCIKNQPNGRLHINDENFSIYNIGRRLVIGGNTICLNLIPHLIKHVNEYDIVHAHSHLFFSTFCCAIVRKLKKYPLVITNHGLTSQTVYPWFQNLYNRTIGRFILRSADCIITYTPTEKELIVDLGVNPQKIQIIHNGIKFSKFNHWNSSPIKKKKQIIWVGRYVAGKGYQYLIEGFAKFSQRFPEYHLLMIGTGNKFSNAKEMIEKHNISNKICMIPSVRNEDMQRYYQESELFVSAALTEGVPKTILEAMFCGLPVISTNLSQLHDIIENCGLLVPVKNSDAIAQALITLASNESMRIKMGENGHEKVIHDYSWDRMVSRTLAIYNDLMKRFPSAGKRQSVTAPPQK